MNTQFKQFLTLLLLFSLMGCTAPATPDGVTTSAPAEAVKTILSNTNQPITSTVTPRATKQDVQLSPSPSPIEMSATPTTAPTFSPKEARELIPRLLKDNGGCQLPCLLSFTPSQSSVNAFNTFRASFGEVDIHNDVLIHSSESKGKGGIYINLWEDSIRNFLLLSYWEKYEKTNVINLYAEVSREEGEGTNIKSKPVFNDPSFRALFGYYLLPNILLTYGRPAQVFLLPFPDDPELPKDSIIPFSLILFYPEKGFFVEYIQPRKEINHQYMACPLEAAYLSIVAWQPKQNATLSDVARYNGGLGLNSLNANDFKTIEDATTMSEDDFYKTFANQENTQGCIETPQSLWQK